MRPPSFLSWPLSHFTLFCLLTQRLSEGTFHSIVSSSLVQHTTEYAHAHPDFYLFLAISPLFLICEAPMNASKPSLIGLLQVRRFLLATPGRSTPRHSCPTVTCIRGGPFLALLSRSRKQPFSVSSVSFRRASQLLNPLSRLLRRSKISYPSLLIWTRPLGIGPWLMTYSLKPHSPSLRTTRTVHRLPLAIAQKRSQSRLPTSTPVPSARPQPPRRGNRVKRKLLCLDPSSKTLPPPPPSTMIFGMPAPLSAKPFVNVFWMPLKLISPWCLANHLAAPRPPHPSPLSASEVLNVLM